MGNWKITLTLIATTQNKNLTKYNQNAFRNPNNRK